MRYKQFKYNFLENEYHLSRYKIAGFTALVVAIGITIGHIFELGLLAGAFIIGAQSVTGINRQGPFRIRLSIAIKASLIISLAALFGAIAHLQYLPIVILLVILLSFCFAWCRQLFPLNWPDIVIPAGVLFFMNYVHKAVLLTFLGAMIGVVCELLLGMFIYGKRYLLQHKVPVPKIKEVLPVLDQHDKFILGLRSDLFLYSIELSLLMIVGFVLMHFTHYPHAYWMPLTAIIVLKVGRRETLKRVLQRTLGTVIGCLIGGAILYLHLNMVLSALVMVLCIFLWICFLRESYAIGTIFITTYLLIQLGGYTDFSFVFVAERIVFTVIGGILALLSSILFLRKERL